MPTTTQKTRKPKEGEKAPIPGNLLDAARKWADMTPKGGTRMGRLTRDVEVPHPDRRINGPFGRDGRFEKGTLLVVDHRGEMLEISVYESHIHTNVALFQRDYAPYDRPNLLVGYELLEASEVVDPKSSYPAAIVQVNGGNTIYDRTEALLLRELFLLGRISLANLQEAHEALDAWYGKIEAEEAAAQRAAQEAKGA